ncbi:MAG: hypothetical protein Kow00108_25550 [Calditrichia bacterium]
MVTEKLHQLQNSFFEMYPDGFAGPEFKDLGKKHKLTEMRDQVRELFDSDRYNNTNEFCAEIAKLYSKSSMVSVFEKVKFRDFMKALTPTDQTELVDALRKLIKGNQEEGFNSFKEILEREKLAKWPLLTILPLYYEPEKEVFIKPTTVKKVIAYFEIPDLKYSPKPTYDFYRRYRDFITELKSRAEPSIARNNAEFSGFLMISIG